MKYIPSVVAILLIVALICGVIHFKQSPSYYSFRRTINSFFQYIDRHIKVTKHNIGMSYSPPRKRPLTFIEKEESLRLYFPDVFLEFDQNEWDKFWAVIYEPIYEKRGKFKVKRYRSRDEIEREFEERYSGLSYFSEDEWNTFWHEVVKISFE